MENVTIEKEHNFNESMERGKQGEIDILNVLQENFQSDKIIDVRDIKKYRDLDIDFIREYMHNGVKKTVSIEIKTDDQAHYTHNFFFEEISNSQYNTLGCFVKTKADWIFYYIKETKEIHILPTKLTQNWFQQHKHIYREIPVRNVDVNTGKISYAKGRIVKIKDVLEALPISTLYFDEKYKITLSKFSTKAQKYTNVIA